MGWYDVPQEIQNKLIRKSGCLVGDKVWVSHIDWNNATYALEQVTLSKFLFHWDSLTDKWDAIIECKEHNGFCYSIFGRKRESVSDRTLKEMQKRYEVEYAKFQALANENLRLLESMGDGSEVDLLTLRAKMLYDYAVDHGKDYVEVGPIHHGTWILLQEKEEDTIAMIVEELKIQAGRK